MSIKKIGKYEISGHIGHGGMADVYKALHPELNRVVALKVLNRALVESAEMLERFRREARAIAALRHPNIVQVFDLDVVDGVYYMVMEYIEGETLRQRLNRLSRRKKRKRMPLTEVLDIITAVGEALHYAHERDMLHRDIKPSNIMFRDDGSVVLTDFGVAKILNAGGNLTVTGTVAGTPAYMSPEQWTTDQPDRRSDIYSLGIVLYQVVTGQLPYKDDTAGRLMFKHIAEAPPLPRKLRPDIPLGLERVILRALAKDPDDRYQTALELVTDLQEVIYEVESTASTDVFKVPDAQSREPQSSEDAAAPTLTRRLPLLWLGAGVIGALVIVITLFLGGFVGGKTPARTPDATGTALAQRLAVLEATLTVETTPSSPPVPANCELGVTLVRDVNYSNPNWWSTINARFDKVWQFQNDGDCAWPEGTVLAHLDGEPFGLDEPFEVGALEEGADLELSVSLRAPETPGQYEGLFQLQTPDGKPIGEPLVVKVEARPRVTSTPESGGEPLEIGGFDLYEWNRIPERDAWQGKIRLWAKGGTGQYTWYRDTLDNPLPGDVLEFEWGVCNDFVVTVWLTSGDEVYKEGLYIPYPEPCD